MTEKRALKTRIRDYFKRKSTFSLISDGIFVVLVVLLIIPSTRKEISAFAIRLTMSSPGMAEDITRIDEQDYHWPLKTLDGKQIDFTRFSDQVIFLNRWATWCPPCIAEMPSIQDLYKDYGKKVAFVLVSNEEPETVKKFMEKKGFTFPVYIS
ncbi:MAG: TlpA family protein disulfide reductase, partial [Bacteroidales bacterium]|nr:TlpA family protein disulfide reductase [Bacteroidales bacterium]